MFKMRGKTVIFKRGLLFFMSLLFCVFLSSHTYSQKESKEIDSLKNVLSKKLSTNSYVDHLNAIAKGYWSINLDSAKVYSDLALKESKKNNYIKGKAKAFNILGVIDYYKSNYEAALHNYQKALKAYKEIHYFEGIISAKINIASIQRAQGNFDKAILSCKYALNALKQIDNKQLFTATNFNMGLVLMDLGKYEEALNYILQSSKSAEINNDQTYLGLSYNSLASIYTNLNLHEKATEYYKKAIDIFTEINDLHNTYFANINLANNFRKLENYKEAKKILTATLDKIKDGKYKFIEAYGYRTFGDVLLEMKDYQLAEKNLLKAYQLSVMMQDAHSLPYILTSLGNVYLNLKNFDAAINYLSLAKKEALQTKNYLHLSYCHEVLHKVYLKKQEFKNALLHYTIHKKYQDSFSLDNREKIIGEMRIKFDTDLKEKENEILRKDNEIQALNILQQEGFKDILYGSLFLTAILLSYLTFRFQKNIRAKRVLKEKNAIIKLQKEDLQKALTYSKEVNDQLTIGNNTKEKLFGVIAHDLINPFNVVLGYTNLLLEDFDMFSDAEKKETIGIINKASVNNHNLVKNLLDWSRLQQNRITVNNENLKIQTLIEDAVAPYLEYAKKKNIEIVYNFELHNLFCDKNILKTAIANLFFNAVKFTKTSHKIFITSKLQNNTKTIEIKDQGVGIAQSRLKKLFHLMSSCTTKGTANEKGSGLGLIITKELIEIAGGTLTINSKVNAGTSVLLTFA